MIPMVKEMNLMFSLLRARAGYCTMLAIVAISLCGCDNIPQDPESTLEKVKMQGEINVGVVHNPPWTNIISSPPQGLEIGLITDFARSLNAAPHWQNVALDEGIRRLEEGQLDILIGGFEQSLPYHDVALTRPFVTVEPEHAQSAHQEHHVMALTRGENRFLVTLEQFLKDHPVSLTEDM
jgi:polar amino acid transport system substrate-binding protein